MLRYRTAPALPFAPPLRTALALSVGLHVILIAGLRTATTTMPHPFAVEHLEVSLVTTPSLRTTHRVPKAPAARKITPSVAASAPVDSTGNAERDEPLVDARFDADTLHNPKPPYPLAARRQGIEGQVMLSAHVLADGSCVEVRLKQSSGYGLLDTAALDTVRRWRFQSARRGGTPVDSWVDIPIRFRLEG